MTEGPSVRPRLRELDRHMVERDGERLVVLTDPHEVCEPIAVDVEFEAVLDLLAGERTLAQIRQTLLMRSGAPDCSLEELEDFVESLRDAGLLDDDVFRRRWAEQHAAFMAMPAREARGAPYIYPGEDDRLDAFLRSAVGDPKRLSTAGGSTRGLWLPAEPVDSLVSILASTLGNLPAASELDAIVVFGADAPRGLLPFATTDKEWTTPWGEVPAARDLVDALESELDWIRREELRLRSGHALELAVVLARWIYGDECPPILPISCAASSLEPRSDEVEAFGEALELATSRRRILWWSSGALSHCGPAYGGTAAELDQQMELDTACIDAVLRGSPGAFAKRVQLDPRARATGAAPTLALLNRISLDTRAELCAYQRIAAPGGAPGAAGNVGLRFVDV